MELRHLRYFVVLAEELHFGRAAKRLHITQPPLSLNIRQLEEDLGARLFERDSRSVQLTPFGAAFLPEALRVLAQAEAAHGTGRALAAGKQGKLHLGFTSTMLFRGMPEILESFRAAHPGIEIQLRDMPTEEQYQSLERRMIDASFSTGPFIPVALAGIRHHPQNISIGSVVLLKRLDATSVRPAQSAQGHAASRCALQAHGAGIHRHARFAGRFRPIDRS